VNKRKADNGDDNEDEEEEEEDNADGTDEEMDEKELKALLVSSATLNRSTIPNKAVVGKDQQDSNQARTERDEENEVQEESKDRTPPVIDIWRGY
jgi:hypothetical protein